MYLPVRTYSIQDHRNLIIILKQHNIKVLMYDEFNSDELWKNYKEDTCVIIFIDEEERHAVHSEMRSIKTNELLFNSLIDFNMFKVIQFIQNNGVIKETEHQKVIEEQNEIIIL